MYEIMQRLERTMHLSIREATVLRMRQRLLTTKGAEIWSNKCGKPGDPLIGR